jgi:GeoRSP system SPASM domain protein
MGLDLLDTPVRLTWDFPVDASGQTQLCLPTIANCIADAGVFFVTLQGGALLHTTVADVLKALAGGCQILISCQGSAEELSRLEQLPRTGFQLQLDVSSFIAADHGVDTDRLQVVVQSLRKLACEPTLALTPLRNNLCNIPELLHFCSEHKITKLKLPNAHIGDSFQSYSAEDLPRWQDLDKFREVWLGFMEDPCQMPILEIHDLFLWEIMTPGHQQSRGEYGGCQAGNSLSHVDHQGVVHPCAAWPQPLGKLPDQSLEEIWAGRERLAVRESIAKVAAGCLGCRDLNICFGGCRGLAFRLNRSGGERDLMCSSPR